MPSILRVFDFGLLKSWSLAYADALVLRRTSVNVEA